MPHQNFFVEELVIFITKELLKCAYSGWEVVSLAHLSRSREPRTQRFMGRKTTLSTLIRVLPRDTMKYALPREHPTGIADNFQSEELVRNFSPSRATSRILVFNLVLENFEGPFEGSLG